MNERIQFIKDYLKKNGITYEQLSADSSTPVNTLKNIFSGRTEHPRIDTVQAIERALGITTDETQKSPQDELSEGEKMLLDLFNRVSDDQQELVLQMIQVALKSQE
jgi:transcriptional regulator with XRE-family HTH domain